MELRFRRATLDDIETLSEIRKNQLQDEGQEPLSDIDHELYHFFREKMEKEDLVEWLAEDQSGEIVATSAILLMDFPPAFNNPSGKKGYITNMYTADEYRGQGIAGKLLQKVEAEAKERGVTKLFLHASEMGRRAYIKSDYLETSEMMIKDLC